MKYCSNCGNPLRPDVKICTNCGAPVNGSSNATQSTQSQGNAQRQQSYNNANMHQQYQPQPKKVRKRLFLLF